MWPQTRRLKLDHVLHPSIVAVLGWRQTGKIPAVGIICPNLLACAAGDGSGKPMPRIAQTKLTASLPVTAMDPIAGNAMTRICSLSFIQHLPECESRMAKQG
jgi:ABC-type enterochelin transport system permease subunit